MDSELLQSFVGAFEDVEPEKRSLYKGPSQVQIKRFESCTPEQSSSGYVSRRQKNLIVIEQKKPRKTKENIRDETYTDKDRAAAVDFGTFDIKKSLKIKLVAERNNIRIMPDETDETTFLMLGKREIAQGNLESGISFLTKAIEISPNDQGALIARSKCYLQLGAPEKALIDAETALSIDKNSIRAIYQKAESLYFLGNFEHSLMFFHRGLRLRPELELFRLGVQKTQEAIENTIGGVKQKPPPTPQKVVQVATNQAHKILETQHNKEIHDRKQARKLLGELFVDKEYLENLLKHPDLKRADTKTENISIYAKDAISFLSNRQEFWRQQKPTNILSSSKAMSESIPQLSHWQD
ncbi:unnamed protein product [Diamesa serratosioi]